MAEELAFMWPKDTPMSLFFLYKYVSLYVERESISFGLRRITSQFAVRKQRSLKGVFTLQQKSNRIRAGLKPDRGNAHSMRIDRVHTAFLAQPNIYAPPMNVA